MSARERKTSWSRAVAGGSGGGVSAEALRARRQRLEGAEGESDEQQQAWAAPPAGSVQPDASTPRCRWLGEPRCQAHEDRHLARQQAAA